MDVNSTTIMLAYGQLTKAHREHFKAGEAALEAKLAYNSMKLAGILNGDITGGNDTTREASAREKLPEQAALMDATAKQEHLAEHKKTLAKLHLDMLHDLLTIAQLDATLGIDEASAP